MTIDFASDFEEGNTSEWDGEATGTGDSITVGAAYRNTGSFGARFISDGSGTDLAYVYKTVTYTEFYARMYIYLDSKSGWANGEEVYFFRALDVGANLIAEIGITMVGGVLKWYLHVYDNGVGSYATGSTVVEDTWYCIKAHFKQETQAGADDGIWTIEVNGVEDMSLTDIGNVEMGNVITLRYGVADISGTITCTLWGDNFAVGDAEIDCISPETYHVLVRHTDASTGLAYEILVGDADYIETTLKAYESSKESHSLEVLGFDKD